MKLRMKLVDKIVGVFILFSILALFAGLVFIGISQRWFRKNYYFRSTFESGAGLNTGMPIKLKGFEIGKLSKISLDPSIKSVNIEFYIYEEYYENTVFENSVLQLAVSPIGLGTNLVFHPGKKEGPPSPPIKEWSVISSNQTVEGKEILKRDVGIAGTGESLGDLVSSIGPLMKQLEPTLLNVNTTLVSINDALQGTKNSKIGQILFDIEDILSQVSGQARGRKEGHVGNILKNVSSISNTLDVQIREELKRIDDIFINLSSITTNIDKITKSPKGLLVDLFDPKGSLKTLFDDNNVLFNDIEEMIDSVKEIINELETIAEFITGSTPQISGLIEEGKQTLNQSQLVLTKLKNEGGMALLFGSGTPKRREQATTYQSYRDEDFE